MSEPANLTIAHIADGVKVIDYCIEQIGVSGRENIVQILALRDLLDKFSSTTETETPAVNLNISHIADLLKVVDFFAEQGAFRGWATIREALGFRDMLARFVLAASPPAPEPTTTTEDIISVP